MDTNTGRIFTQEQIRTMRAATMSPKEAKEFEARIKMMVTPPTEKQLARHPPRVGKYDPCLCGSGKKFKWCCYTGSKKGSK